MIALDYIPLRYSEIGRLFGILGLSHSAIPAISFPYYTTF